MLECLAATAGLQAQLRPPAVPLVTHDPYFSIWSAADHAYDRATTHWTGRPQALTATISVDGKSFRLLGDGEAPPLPQTGLRVTATQTAYTFANPEIQVTMRFVSPLLPHDLDFFSRPITYVSFETKSRDDREHVLRLQFSMAGTVATNSPDQKVVAKTILTNDLQMCRIGSTEQPVLAKKGDDLRIDWGYAYLAAPIGSGWVQGASRSGSGSAADTVADMTREIGRCRSSLSWLMIGYDDEVSIRYFDQDLRPYWRRKGADMESVLLAAGKHHEAVIDKCDAFDRRLATDLEQVGGEKYAQIATLAYRQAVAGTKLVADGRGRPLLFPKENFSNGCIGTVDVIYPMAPLWFLLGSDLSRAMLIPVLDYGSSARWKFPFAPHDLGTYPHATGQVYGGGELTEDNQMPVEESGNMILLVAALAEIEGNASLAKKYWPHLTKWAKYLRDKGLDPANQLCTDDFMGHLAHNANLSVKAILAIGAFGKLAHRLGDTKLGDDYQALSREYAKKWVELAQDGDHTKLAFDKPGTWSQKYNMVWDDILDLNLFPKAIKTDEIAFYKRSLNRYGLPLDNRSTGMKVDWMCWTATLSRDKSDFEALIAPTWDFLNETEDRVPICDWVRTDSTKHIGMIARPVLGGAFLPILHDRTLWKAWFERGVKSASPWAPFPLRKRSIVVPTAATAPADWRFTTSDPGKGWHGTDFDDHGWSVGKSGFGTKETPGTFVNTRWQSEDIWIRRHVAIPQTKAGTLHLSVHHDEDVEIYINGVLAAKASGYTTGYTDLPIAAAALKTIHPGKPNLIAAHCHQTGGGQFIDIGLTSVVKR